MLGRLLRAVERVSSALTPSDRAPVEGEHRHFTLQLPLDGQPLCRVELQAVTEPVTGGERTRIHAHVQTRIGSVLRPALMAARQNPAGSRPALQVASDPRRSGAGLPARAGRLARQTVRGGLSRALQLPAIRRIAEPLLQLDIDTWMELNASDAPLDAGSRDLIPQAQRLAALGIHPQAPGDRPQAQTWVMEAADGFAQVSILQVDGHHLPAALRGSGKPVSLALAIVNSVKRV